MTRLAANVPFIYKIFFGISNSTSTDPTLFQLTILDLDLDEPINKEGKEK